MAQTADLYALLGLGRDASPEEIKRAYRRLAREHHPDVSGAPDDDARFKEVSAAYEILSDPDKRRQYDLFGSGGGPMAGQQFGDVGDIFEFFFGGANPFGGSGRRRRPSRTQPGEAIVASMRMTFEEAAFGTTTELPVDAFETCATCEGTGCAPGTRPERCATCGGRGEQQTMQQSIFGSVMTMRACGTCRGSGESVPSPCQTCRGEGRTAKSHVVTIEVPAGVADGMELRVSGAGNAGRAGGAPGDLYVRLQVRPHEVFARRGQDLYAVLEVPMTQASLGAELEVQTLDGSERVKLERGTETGSILRLRGHGLPQIERKGRGDLYLTVRVGTPEPDGKEERRLMESLADLRGETTSKSDPGKGSLRRPHEGD